MNYLAQRRSDHKSNASIDSRSREKMTVTSERNINKILTVEHYLTSRRSVQATSS